MHHAIVKRIARRNLERVNQKDYNALLKGCAPNVHHRFGGEHALAASGTIARHCAADLSARAGSSPQPAAWRHRATGSARGDPRRAETERFPGDQGAAAP